MIEREVTTRPQSYLVPWTIFKGDVWGVSHLLTLTICHFVGQKLQYNVFCKAKYKKVTENY